MEQGTLRRPLLFSVGSVHGVCMPGLRPRERARLEGVHALDDKELLATNAQRLLTKIVDCSA